MIINYFVCFCIIWIAGADYVANALLDKPIYVESNATRNYDMSFAWNEVDVTMIIDHKAHHSLLKEILPSPGMVNSTFFVPQPVYISLTTMASRMSSIHETISNLLQARIVPTMIFLFVSDTPFLIDAGVKKIPEKLLCLVAAGYLRIVFTQNIGPHRKLLPLLKRYWGKDVIITTMDDDLEKDQSHVNLYQLLKYYETGGRGDKMVSLRARRIGMCKDLTDWVIPYSHWGLADVYDKTEMLVLPTGNGGVLYKPNFFHKIVFNKSFRKFSTTADDITFRLATLIKNIPVRLGCIIFRNQLGFEFRNCEYDDVDRRYDKMYGSSSTQYYMKAIREVSIKLQEEARLLNAEVKEDKELVAQDSTERKLYLNMDKNISAVGSEIVTKNVEEMEQTAGHDCVRFNEECDRNDCVHRVLRPARKKPNMDPTKQSNLFAFNKQGGNDVAWRDSLSALKSTGLFSLQKMILKYKHERGSRCLGNVRFANLALSCSVFPCSATVKRHRTKRSGIIDNADRANSTAII